MENLQSKTKVQTGIDDQGDVADCDVAQKNKAALGT